MKIGVFRREGNIFVPENATQFSRSLEKEVDSTHKRMSLVDAHGNALYQNRDGEVVSEDKVAAYNSNLGINLNGATLGDFLKDKEVFEYTNDDGEKVTVDLGKDETSRRQFAAAIEVIQDAAKRYGLDIYDAKTDTLNLSDKHLNGVARLVDEYALSDVDNDSNVYAKVETELGRIVRASYVLKLEELRAKDEKDEQAREKVVQMPARRIRVRVPISGGKAAAAAALLGAVFAGEGCYTASGVAEPNGIEVHYSYIEKKEEITRAGIPGSDAINNNSNVIGIANRLTGDNSEFILDLGFGWSSDGRQEVGGQESGTVSEKTHRYVVGWELNRDSTFILGVLGGHTGHERTLQDYPVGPLTFDPEIDERLGLLYKIRIGNRKDGDPSIGLDFTFERNDDLDRKDYSQLVTVRYLFEPDEHQFYVGLAHRTEDERERYNVDELNTLYLALGMDLRFGSSGDITSGVAGEIMLDLEEVAKIGSAEFGAFWNIQNKSRSSGADIGLYVIRISGFYDNHSIGDEVDSRERTNWGLRFSVERKF